MSARLLLISAFPLVVLTACFSRDSEIEMREAARAGPPDMQPGDTVAGALAASDGITEGSLEDGWRLDLEAGQRVRLEMRSDSFDAELWVRGPATTIVAANDDALGRDAAVTFRVAATGRYVALARAARPREPQDSSQVQKDPPPAPAQPGPLPQGPYTLSLARLTDSVADPGAGAELGVGDTVVGLLESGDSLASVIHTRIVGSNERVRVGLVDYLTFRPESSGAVAIDLVSPHFDAWLAVGDSTGAQTIASDDDAGGGTQARIVLRVEAGTRYRVAAASFGADRGNGRYAVTARMAPGERLTTSRAGGAPLGLLPAAETRVCDGKPMPVAAAYSRDVQAAHPTAVVEMREEPWRVPVPGWAPARHSELELVACLTHVEAVLQVCYYMGPSITRYRHRWTAELREARTAATLGTVQVQGDLPRACQRSEPYSLTRLSGSLGSSQAALEQLRGQLLWWVDPSSPQAVAPPVRRAPREPAPVRRPGDGKRPMVR